MLSGKPFLTAITDIANWIKEEGLRATRSSPSPWRSTPIWTTPKR